ncbi:SDR family NAD(P)-dependent oxidoreductase [Amnimonas aquatica]|uniref:Short-chain dehydrogenase n=1 Tax=Amnimonas aquatica TaxID=2094561 RepID=A0A2P6AST9_9GAMM|nr:SDR family oxidoreductase [Amnimonas aquatica]PQA44336.1 short-chain dehydrogenase [Amnimonas aquatica]
MSTALITGASNGIGLELARRLAADGHDVILVARSVDKLQALADELGGRHGIRAEVIGQDLGYEGAAQELVDKLGDRRVDMLINNAGFGEFGTFIEADIKRLNQMIQLNVATLTALAHAFGRRMAAQGGGQILNVASIAAFMPGPGAAVYYASKAYVLSFSDALDFELRGKNVRVTTLCPGPTDTGFATAANAEGSAAFRWPLLASLDSLADYAYDSLKAKRGISVHRWLIKLMAFSVRLSPRFLANYISARSIGFKG